MHFVYALGKDSPLDPWKICYVSCIYTVQRQMGLSQTKQGLIVRQRERVQLCGLYETISLRLQLKGSAPGAFV